MAKIVRFNGNLVAPASAALGTERTLFGSASQADDLTSQFTADLLRGWGIVGPSDQPTLQDFNAMGYTLGQLHAYLHQMGVAEWDAAQEYHIGSIANVSGVLYRSLTNTNVGNPPTSSPASWAEAANFLNTARVDVASAATVNLTSAAPNTRNINITGGVTITAFTVAVGQLYFVRFAAALTLTNNAGIVTQTGSNISVQAGDTCIIRATAANVVEVLCYSVFKSQALGYGQTWQDMTGSRLVSTNYTNTTGKPIKIHVSAVASTSSAGWTLTIDGFVMTGTIVGGTTSNAVDITQIIPPGAVYSLAGRAISKWSELR